MYRLASLILITVLTCTACGREPRLGPDGRVPQVDYPQGEWIKNIGAKRAPHYGMCVFTSFEMMCRWHGMNEWRGFRDYVSDNDPEGGGGYPSKLAAWVKKYADYKKIPEPEWWQYEGPNFAYAADALKCGRMTCTTLTRSPRYRGPVAHMVCMAAWDANGYFAVLDNNGDDNYDWGKLGEAPRWLESGGGRIWLVGVLAPPPPLPPSN